MLKGLILVKHHFILLLITTVLGFSYNSMVFAKALKIAVVHSYLPSTWTAQSTAGIQRGLKQEGIETEVTEVTYDSFALEKRTTAEKAQATEEIVSKIKQISPALVFICDDEAADALVPQLRLEPFPVILSGINKDAESTEWFLPDGHPKRNFTGVFERYPFVQYLKLLKRIYPNVTDITVLTSENNSSKIITAQLKQFFKENHDSSSGVNLKKIIMSEKWSIWKNFIASKHAANQAIWVLVPWNVNDSSGREVPVSDIGQFIRKNSRVAAIGIVTIVHQMGFLAAFAVGPDDMGEQAAELGARIINKNLKARDIPFQKVANVRLVVNKERAQELGVTIPADLLEFATIEKRVKSDFGR